MKNAICFLIFMCSMSVIKAQTAIIHLTKKANGNILFDNQANLSSTSEMLPVKLVFDSSFKNNKISFYLSNNSSQLISEGKFEEDFSTVNNTLNYEINFKSNGTIDPDISGTNVKLSTGKFYFTINNGTFFYGPFNVISYKTMYIVGNIFNDALKLSELINTSSDSLIRLKIYILNSYGIRNSSTLDSNKFLQNSYKDLFDPTLGFIQAAGGSNTNFISSTLSSIGGLDVTNLADGLAKFIIKRAKQELSIAFFKKFKADLEKYPDLKTVFPATYNLLEAIDHEIYNYANYIKNLREAFRADLKIIDENLPGVIDNHSAYFARPGNFELGLALRTGCYVTTSLKHDMHPGDILDTYPTSFFDGAPSADKAKLDILKGSIQSLQLFNESLKEGDTLKHSYWVGIDKIRQVVNDKSAFKIYIGLVLQVAKIKYEKVKFSATINLYDQLNTSANVTSFDNSLDTYTAYKQYILNLGSKVSEIGKMIKEYEKPASDSLKIEQYAKYFKASEGLIAYCIQVGKLPILKDLLDLQKLDSITKTYFDIANETTDLVLAINRKNYSEIGNHVVVIYNKIVVERAADSTTFKNVVAALVKYGAFMANLINANNSDEVASAIESVALPVGSSRIKRETPFNVSLNAYGGFFVGHEFINGINDKHSINSYGVTAPVGVAISWGSKHGLSTSLFISLLDVGVVAAYRINNDTVSQVPTIQLKDIFSPGAFLSIGIPKTPLSFNLGAQFGPNLRKVMDAKNDYSNKTYVRLSASICVDIPVLNFYTKSK